MGGQCSIAFIVNGVQLGPHPIVTKSLNQKRNCFERVRSASNRDPLFFLENLVATRYSGFARGPSLDANSQAGETVLRILSIPPGSTLVTPEQHQNPCSNTGSPSSTCRQGGVFKNENVENWAEANCRASGADLLLQIFSSQPRGNWCYRGNHWCFSTPEVELGGKPVERLHRALQKHSGELLGTSGRASVRRCWEW